MVALGGAVVTVETDAVAVEQRLGSGGLVCPGCSGVLAGWGVRGAGRFVTPTVGCGSCRGGRGAPVAG